ncbi:hypothetical protein [Vibrio parahaemolyticus]|uniref:hypothetical protein n=3 Tax=Vibrio TaxID=662 RepID=UPI0011207EFD|nr:hypothetical protein [Vibrio parahaemolyticus]MCG6506687.1 hypothetical protein [Vibrio parahaemolyticus]MDG2648378.1 hypothetical protein [Vibrio parahaemolyticus]HCE2108122.1 hypothetical protein [Vibrio parahaemolyticus]HCE2113107.1 hypothetical protein [Vibrio parahaemolyticus]HCG6302583.1 hypothetical protein [Vibrio parahaemolyticus]
MKKTIAFFAILLSGCTSLGITEQKVVKVNHSNGENGELEIVSFPAQLRGAYVYTGADGEKFVCAEPFTDVAASSSLNATASAVNNLATALNKSANATRDLQGADASGSNETTLGYSTQTEQSINVGLNTVNQIVALEGRTQFVLLAREMLFRTCEAAANGYLNSTETIVAQQHQKVFTALTQMVDTEKAKAQAEQAQADANKIKAVAAAAEKLDPKILAVFTGLSLNEVILTQYLNEYTTCTNSAGSDVKKQQKCTATYHSQLTKLMGTK